MAKGHWRSREDQIADELGLRRVAYSGAGVEKGDAVDDNVLCEIKTTRSKGIRLSLDVIKKLEREAATANKLPVYAVDLWPDSEPFPTTYVAVRLENLKSLAEWINGNDRENEYDNLRSDI